MGTTTVPRSSATPRSAAAWFAGTRPQLNDIRVVAIVVGIGGMLVSFAGSWIPSFWGDEAASLMSAQRSLPSLFGMLYYVDAVHGTYYLFLHGWIGLFGASELSVRLPSAIGIGVAAAGVVILGNRMLSRRVGILAGIIFALLPRVTSVGEQARSYGLGIAAAIWLTVLLVWILGREGVKRRHWLMYSLGLAGAVYLFLYLALIAIVHAALVLSTSGMRAMFSRWLRAVAIAVAISLPMVVWGWAQHRQISFLARRYDIDFRRVFIEPWFAGSSELEDWTSTLWLSALCWTLVLIGGGWLLWSIRASSGRATPGPDPSGRAGAREPAMPRAAAALLLAWLILPAGILLLGNELITPMYSTRYLAFCAPAVALLIAAGICVLRGNWQQASVTVLLIALVVPGYLVQRSPFAMDGSDWREVSTVIGQQARPGDAVVFGAASRPSRMPRLAMRVYPEDYRGLWDVGLVTPYYRLSQLHDRVAGLDTVGFRLADATTVWAVAPLPAEASGVPEDVATLQRLGFRLVRDIPFHRNGVYELTRAPAAG